MTYITYIHPACCTGGGTHARRRSLTVCGALLLQSQWAPLHIAAYFGRGSVVDQLLQGRADVNLQGEVRAGSRVFVFLRGDVGFFSCGGDSVYVCACVYTYMYIYMCVYIIWHYAISYYICTYIHIMYTTQTHTDM